MRSWAFESLLSRLPDDDHLVLELGAPSGLIFPREVGRVTVSSPGTEHGESTKIIHVEGDISHVPTVLNAAALGLDFFGYSAIMLLSVGGLDNLSPGDASELCELLLSESGPCAAAILKTRHKLSWRFSEDPDASGLVSRIQDYQPQTQSHRDPWWLYVRPEDERE